MSRLPGFLLNLFGLLIVAFFGLRTGHPGFVAAVTSDTPRTDEPVFSLAEYADNCFEQLSLPSSQPAPIPPGL